MAENDTSKKYSQTLNLPKTDFPIRANHTISDLEVLERWKSQDLYKLTFEHNIGNEKFILHDGPPYANGNIHLGSAYNKILKDISSKLRRMSGYHTPVTPGWDCHGLPIEQKVAQENPGLDRIEMKKACRAYATKWIDIQRNSFKSLGVLMNWDKPYITMSFDYEANILRALKIIIKQDLIERKNKAVPWCPSCKTALASVEIEYKDRKDPSIYTLFTLDAIDSRKAFDIDQPINLIIWTTTPWTLPLNKAVLAHPDSQYSIIKIDQELYILGSQVAEKLALGLGVELNVIKTFNSGFFKDIKVNHPFLDMKVPIIFDDSVITDDGTALVHCAPGCGPIDYEVGIKNNLEIYSPISDAGTYTEPIEPKELLNMPVSEGQFWVLKKLKEIGKLLYKTNIVHSYPHCWRCRGGLIFRATPQWFFDLNQENIKGKALKAIEQINFIPKDGRNFLKATVSNRLQWCISRQRVWGVFIPALLCNNCCYGFFNLEIIDKAIAGVEKEGIEYWDKVTLQDLENQVSEKLTCPNCKSSDLQKEEDILDVWFESGVSHYAVLYNNKDLKYPANLYLEGVDQHRGWFQSSLLTSLVVEKEASMKSILTHGFIVDSKGQKMSKSLGNVVYPEDIIKKIGTDGLRLWAASIGVDSDPIVSDALLENVSQVYRKIRNTCRFLLLNLYDFDIDKDAVQLKDLMPIDYYAILELEAFNTKMLEEYFQYNFTSVFHGLGQYVVTELSSFYMDIVKDRLYTEKADSFERRSAQTALWYILDTITKLMAPIMSLTAELVSDHYQKDKKQSIHLQDFVNPLKFRNLYNNTSSNPGSKIFIDLDKEIKEYNKLRACQSLVWTQLRQIRSEILKAIEVEREKGIIKHSLEARVILYVNLDLPEYALIKQLFAEIESKGMSVEDFMKEFLIVSQIQILDNPNNNITIQAEKALGTKCPRCWQWKVDKPEDDLCQRCSKVLNI